MNYVIIKVYFIIMAKKYRNDIVSGMFLCFYALYGAYIY